MLLIEELIRNEKITVIMTTHDPEMARRADRILIFKNGQLVEEKIQDKDTFDFRAPQKKFTNDQLGVSQKKSSASFSIFGLLRDCLTCACKCKNAH